MSQIEIMEAAKAFAKKHVSACSAELLEWSETAILVDGCLRELARMLQPIAGEHRLDVARSLVVTEALEIAKEATR